jgi:hypothetical protein
MTVTERRHSGLAHNDGYTYSLWGSVVWHGR